jgi:hypothetical protein
MNKFPEETYYIEEVSSIGRPLRPAEALPKYQNAMASVLGTFLSASFGFGPVWQKMTRKTYGIK